MKCEQCGAECIIRLSLLEDEFGCCSGIVEVFGEEQFGDDWIWIHHCEAHIDNVNEIYY